MPKLKYLLQMLFIGKKKEKCLLSSCLWKEEHSLQMEVIPTKYKLHTNVCNEKLNYFVTQHVIVNKHFFPSNPKCLFLTLPPSVC